MLYHITTVIILALFTTSEALSNDILRRGFNRIMPKSKHKIIAQSSHSDPMIIRLDKVGKEANRSAPNLSTTPFTTPFTAHFTRNRAKTVESDPTASFLQTVDSLLKEDTRSKNYPQYIDSYNTVLTEMRKGKRAEEFEQYGILKKENDTTLTPDEIDNPIPLLFRKVSESGRDEITPLDICKIMFKINKETKGKDYINMGAYLFIHKLGNPEPGIYEDIKNILNPPLPFG